MTVRRDWLIIANGETLIREKARQLAEGKNVLALDGAAMQCLAYEIEPDLVIGDFDSLTQSDIAILKNKNNIELRHDACQNSTDLEKALKYLEALQPTSVTICHATGYRLDHSLYNLRLLKRFHGRLNKLSLITNHERVHFIRNEKICLRGQPNQYVAVLSFTCATLNSAGLKYDMHDYEIKHGEHESACNSLAKSQAVIKIDGEALVLVDHDVTVSTVF